MLHKKLYFLSSVFIISIFALFSCKKYQLEESTLSPKVKFDFMFTLGFRKDTILAFDDTEKYKIDFENSTGESRCASLDCSSCPYSAGKSGIKLKLYNSQGDSIAIQPFVEGCRVEEADSAIVMLNLHDLNPNFHISIGIKKITPYPLNYGNNSIHFSDYVATFRVIKES